jgi:hypothetical protein
MAVRRRIMTGPRCSGGYWVWGFVTCDLMLLENKIPFFILGEAIRAAPDGTLWIAAVSL